MLDFVYPHLYALDETDPYWGVGGDEYIPLPSRLPLSGANLSLESVYLMTGEEGLCLLVSKNLPQDLCQRLFNEPTIVNTTHASLIALVDTEDPLVVRIHNVLDSLKEMYGEHLQVRVILRGEKEMAAVSRCLRDDRVGTDASLSEFVCSFFKKVLEKYKYCLC